MSISLDFSTKTELRPLAMQVRALRAAAAGRPLLLVGAKARDLLLLPYPNIPVARATEDVDFAVAVESWADFEAVRTELLSSGFSEIPGVAHRLRSAAGLIDLIPFAGVEDANRMIAWPPKGETVMNLAGFQEALTAAILVRLPDDLDIPVVSLPALVMMKLFAWRERMPDKRVSDARDIGLILRNYLDAGHKDRLWSECADWVAAADFDSETASARLLGRDLALLLRLNPATFTALRESLLGILTEESDMEGTLLLAGEMNLYSGNAPQLLAACKMGLSER